MGLKRRNVRSVNKKDKDIGGISLSDYQKEAIKIAIANKKENNKIEICASEENKEDIKEVTAEKVELANDMAKTPIEPINELTDTIKEDTSVAEVAEEKVIEVQEEKVVVEDVDAEEKEEKEVEDLNTEKDDVAKIIEEENNKSEEDKRVICLDTGIVYENSKDAESKTVAKANAITRCCRGNCKKAGKLRWQYYSDYLLEK